MTERDVFVAALQLSDPAERGAFLDRVYGDRAEARGRLEALLSERERLGDFLERPAVASEATLAEPQPAGEEAGRTVIGPYKLLEVIGEGGMGTVWMADQVTPIRRRVAIKV